jgi:hypothetical protein
MKKFLVNAAQWLLFAAGIAVCVGSGHVLHGNAAHAATVGGLVVSLVFGSLVARKEPVKSWLSTRPVLWSLFLFNGAVAVGAGLFVHGAQGVGTAIGMGLVSLGAGSGLLRRQPSPAES